MARTNGPIQVWNRNDTTPTDLEGGYAGGDSTAAAVGTSLDQSSRALGTVDNLVVTASTLDYGQEATATISGTSPWKTIEVGIPKGMPDTVGAQLVTDAQTAAQQSTASAADADAAVLLAQQAQAAAYEVPDNAMRDIITNPATETGTLIRAREVVINLADHGAVGDGVTDDAPAVQSAVNAAAVAGGTVDVPEGVYLMKANVTVTASRVRIKGRGRGSILQFNNAGIIVDSGAAIIEGFELRDVVVKRFGAITPGPAVTMTSDGTDTSAVTRFTLSGVHIDNSQSGPALQMSGCWVGSIIACLFRNSDVGVRLVKSASGTSLNAASFISCEWQLNDQAVEADNTLGVNFIGCTVQGNTLGVSLLTARGTLLSGCYFEANGGYDVRLAGDPARLNRDGSPQGVSVTGCTFLGFSDSRPALDLRRVQGLLINSNTFRSYQQVPVQVIEDYAGAVQGKAIGNALAGGASTQMFEFNGARSLDDLDMTAPRIVSSSVDNSRASNVTTTADEVLTMTLEPGSYMVEVSVPYTATAANGIKLGLYSDAPGEWSGAVALDGPGVNGDGTSMALTRGVLLVGNPPAVRLSGGGGTSVAYIKAGVTLTSSVSRVLALNWAQYLSGTTATKVLAGASMRVVRVR